MMKDVSKFEKVFPWLRHPLSLIMIIFITVFVVNLGYAYVYFDGRAVLLHLIIGIVSGLMGVTYFRLIREWKYEERCRKNPIKTYEDVENRVLAKCFDEMVFAITVSVAIIVFYVTIFFLFHLKNFDLALIAAFIILSLTISFRYFVTRYRMKRGWFCNNRHEAKEALQEIEKELKK